MGYKVLLSDDSAFMRNMLKKLVNEAGSEVVGEAADGQQAIDKYKELKPDIVFMDIMMPNMDGIQALKGIKQVDKSSNVVMCTSVGQEKVVNQAVEEGASDFITKPFKKEDVLSVLQN
ncbi:MAG: response regulator [Nanobdellota archaeon]